MFTVYFHHATTTPSQPGLSQLVEAALIDCGAERTGLEAEIRLSDNALLYLFGEDEDGLMLAEYAALTPAVANALQAILRRTNSFLLDAPESSTFLRAAGCVGEPRGVSGLGIELLEIETEDALMALLLELPDNGSSVGPTLTTSPREAKRGSPFMDFLFGKPG